MEVEVADREEEEKGGWKAGAEVDRGRRGGGWDGG